MTTEIKAGNPFFRLGAVLVLGASAIQAGIAQMQQKAVSQPEASPQMTHHDPVERVLPVVIGGNPVDGGTFAVRLDSGAQAVYQRIPIQGGKPLEQTVLLSADYLHSLQLKDGKVVEGRSTSPMLPQSSSLCSDTRLAKTLTGIQAALRHAFLNGEETVSAGIGDAAQKILDGQASIPEATRRLSPKRKSTSEGNYAP